MKEVLKKCWLSLFHSQRLLHLLGTNQCNACVSLDMFQTLKKVCKRFYFNDILSELLFPRVPTLIFLRKCSFYASQMVSHKNENDFLLYERRRSNPNSCQERITKEAIGAVFSHSHKTRDNRQNSTCKLLPPFHFSEVQKELFTYMYIMSTQSKTCHSWVLNQNVLFWDQWK